MILIWSRFKLYYFFRVANIRFNVAKVLQSFIPIVDQSVSNFSFMVWLCISTFSFCIQEELTIYICYLGDWENSQAMPGRAGRGSRCRCPLLFKASTWSNRSSHDDKLNQIPFKFGAIFYDIVVMSMCPSYLILYKHQT